MCVCVLLPSLSKFHFLIFSFVFSFIFIFICVVANPEFLFFGLFFCTENEKSEKKGGKVKEGKHDIN